MCDTHMHIHLMHTQSTVQVCLVCVQVHADMHVYIYATHRDMCLYPHVYTQGHGHVYSYMAQTHLVCTDMYTKIQCADLTV